MHYAATLSSQYTKSRMVRDAGFELGDGLSQSITYNARLTRRLTKREHTR